MDDWLAAQGLLVSAAALACRPAVARTKAVRALPPLALATALPGPRGFL